VLSQTANNCCACTLTSLYAGRIYVQSCAAAVQLLFSNGCKQGKPCFPSFTCWSPSSKELKLSMILLPPSLVSEACCTHHKY